MKKKKYKEKIRITSGLFKGRLLHSIKNFNIRPTNSRTKKTIFNWLRPYIKNKTCLDCFTGSGSLSIESISHLARYVTALEINKKLIKKLNQTLKNFSIKSIKTYHINTINWLKKHGTPYDIIYLDPPFKDINLLKKTIFLLNKNNWLHKKSIIYVEQSIYMKEKLLYINWIIFKQKKIGKVLCTLYIAN